jgi:hypothetical protein
VSTWPILEEAALYGLAGEVVGAISPESEADPAALLATFLTFYGNAVGGGPHARVGGAQHPARLNALIVGDTARSRKGQSYADIRPVFTYADPAWCDRILNGFGSGEAVVDAVRDPSDDDPGASDKRALIFEPEFSRILRVSRRDGSTLGAIGREAWDSGRLAVRTVGRGVRVATGAHISTLAHITAEELERELLDVDIANGYANRYIYWGSRRSKWLPSGGNLDEQVFMELGGKVQARLTEARKVGIMHRTPDAEARWSEWYLAEDDAARGLFGAVTARAAAQVLRLSVTYALTDGAHHIDTPHLEAALAAWAYCEASARYLFASTTGDPTADRLLERLLEVAPAGLDGSEQHALFAKHRTARQLADARYLLEALGLAETVTQSTTGGRPRLITFANMTGEESELAKQAGNGQAFTAHSLSSPSEARP